MSPLAIATVCLFCVHMSLAYDAERYYSELSCDVRRVDVLVRPVVLNRARTAETESRRENLNRERVSETDESEAKDAEKESDVIAEHRDGLKHMGDSEQATEKNDNKEQTGDRDKATEDVEDVGSSERKFILENINIVVEHRAELECTGTGNQFERKQQLRDIFRSGYSAFPVAEDSFP